MEEKETDKKWEDDDSVSEHNAFVKGLDVNIGRRQWDKLFGWCRAAKSECSGLGLIEKKGGKFEITEVYLLKQISTAAHTELDAGAIAELQGKLHKRDVPLSQLRFWWHTHYNFSTFWSGTDVDTAEKLAGSSADWILSLVINQGGDYRCRLDFMEPVRVALDELTVNVHHETDKELLRKCGRQVRNLVNEPRHDSHRTVHGFHGGHHGGYNGGYGYGSGYGYGDGWEDWDPEKAGLGKKDSQRKLPMGGVWKGDPNIRIQHPSYWNKQIEKWMVWVEYLRCHVPEGSEMDSSYKLDGKSVTREQLRQIMIDREEADNRKQKA